MKLWWAAGAVMAGLAVAAGAFGAHALKGRLSPELLQVFETGVRYQMYHALGLLAVAVACDRWPEANFNVVGWLLVAGIFLFSGSLYLLCLTGIRAAGCDYSSWRALLSCWMGCDGLENCPGVGQLQSPGISQIKLRSETFYETIFSITVPCSSVRRSSRPR